MREPPLAKLFSVSPWERVSSLAPDAYAPSRGIELRPVSDEVAARVPQTRRYRYVVASNRVLLVGTSRIVVGVFADANAQ